MNLQNTDQDNLSISSQFQPFVSSLQVFINKYEAVTIKISEKLPEIEKQIENNITEARDLLNFLFSSTADIKEDGTKGKSGVKKEISRFHTKLDNILADLTDMNSMDKQVFTDLKNSIEISNNTINEMGNIFDISESLKVYAINSIINSQKAGDKGKGYQVISAEFIKLSEQIAMGTRKITGISAQFQSEVIEFLNAVENLEKFSNNHIKVIANNSGEILKKANTSIENFSKVLNDLLNRIESSKDPTYQIMIELQKQDIIHQQLTHLVKNIDDILVILKDNTHNLDLPIEMMSEDIKHKNRSLYTLMIFLIENTENQINRISVEFIEMIDNLEKLFLVMNNSVIDIGEDKAEFARIVVKEEQNNKFDNNSVIGFIFDSPCDLIDEMRKNIKILLEQKKNILNLFVHVESKIKDKKTHAQVFLPLIGSIENLLLLSRIEQARNNLDFPIVGSGKTVDFFHESFADLSLIISDIEKAHSLVIENFRRTEESFDIQENHYATMDSQFTESIAVLQETKRIFMKNFETVMDITTEMIMEISRYNMFFKELRGLNDEIQRDIAVCAQVKDTVYSKLDALGGILPLQECHFKEVIYQNIVEKCTVAQERETIRENFSEFEIEDSMSNSITLF